MRIAIGFDAGSTFPRGAPGLHGVIVNVRFDLTTEPPAHCRLVSGHDLFEMVASLNCTPALGCAGMASGETRDARKIIIPRGETWTATFPAEPTRARVRAPGRAGQGRPQAAPQGSP